MSDSNATYFLFVLSESGLIYWEWEHIRVTFVFHVILIDLGTCLRSVLILKLFNYSNDERLKGKQALDAKTKVTFNMKEALN